MRSTFNHIALLSLFLPGVLLAAPGLTIYNQNFAVVRDTVPLDLKTGVNDVTFDRATLLLEPDSVILRDPSGSPLQVLEQNYRNDPVTQPLLLSLFEGKELDFLVHEINKPDRVVRGTIIRSGYVAHGEPVQPIIQVDGKIQFSLPGEPAFPSLGVETILKPQLNWKINVPKAIKTEAEVGYITGGMSWEASYNLVLPEKGDLMDVVGWITMDNQSGRAFSEAKISLMAGDVNKIADMRPGGGAGRVMNAMAFAESAAVVSEKTFDEYHLYTLERPATLKDREKKQVEFVRTTGVKSEELCIYDGTAMSEMQWRPMDPNFRRINEEFGTQSNTKVTVFRQFRNTKENGLGIPLPKGRLRFYRSNGTQLEFIGENSIDHTPSDELVKIKTGDSFDLVGERKRVSFKVDQANHWADESFEISLRNRKKESVSIRVVEHLYRWSNWEITKKSDDFTKLDSDKIEFLIPVKAGEERKVTYTVHYSW